MPELVDAGPLQQQLAERDRCIAALELELQDKNARIAETEAAQSKWPTTVMAQRLRELEKSNAKHKRGWEDAARDRDLAESHLAALLRAGEPVADYLCFDNGNNSTVPVEIRELRALAAALAKAREAKHG